MGLTEDARCNVSSARPGVDRTSHNSAVTEEGAGWSAALAPITPPRNSATTLRNWPSLPIASLAELPLPAGENSSRLLTNATSSDADRSAHDPVAGTVM